MSILSKGYEEINEERRINREAAEAARPSEKNKASKFLAIEDLIADREMARLILNEQVMG